MYIYVQNSGQLMHNGQDIARGYSGSGADKNCPASQFKHNCGPIPVGSYEIQEPHDSPAHGPYAMGLAPHMDNHMFGRSGFLMHGDSLQHFGQASEGCIILDRAIRERVWDSGDHYLTVIAEDLEFA
jgi:hypothetical protein